jgi:hypothetical protein
MSTSASHAVPGEPAATGAEAADGVPEQPTT